MQAIISTISAAAVGLHLVLGCCLHHGHAAGLAEQGAAACAEPLAHGHQHEHEHHEGAPCSGRPGSGAPEHEDCHESPCTFLAAGKALGSLSGAAASLPPLSAVLPQGSLGGLAKGLPPASGNAHCHCACLYLLHQVFLI